jgi:hypothetical protein
VFFYALSTAHSRDGALTVADACAKENRTPSASHIAERSFGKQKMLLRGTTGIVAR